MKGSTLSGNHGAAGSSIRLNLEFCDRYAYPPEIREHLVRILSVIDPAEVRSVLLYGSTALGEICFRRSDSGIELYSDYDFIIIARDKVDRQYKIRLNTHFAEVEKTFQDNPFLHINFRYVDAAAYRKGFNNVAIVDGRDGIVVYGEDLRDSMQEFNSGTMNHLLHNEMLIWALWKMIIFFPPGMLSENADSGGDKRDWWIYTICKEAMVIPMWLLPREGIFLSSYRMRIEYLKEHRHDLKAGRFFDEHFVDLLTECYRVKTGDSFSGDVHSLYIRIIGCFGSALRCLKSDAGLSEDAELADERGRFFIDNDARRVLYDLYLVFFKSDRRGMGKPLRWIIPSKYGLMLDILYDLHLSLYFHLLDRKPESAGHLERAYGSARKLTLRDSSLNNEGTLIFPGTWIMIRDALADFLNLYIPSLKSYNEKILGLMNNGMADDDR